MSFGNAFGLIKPGFMLHDVVEDEIKCQKYVSNSSYLSFHLPGGHFFDQEYRN